MRSWLLILLLASFSYALHVDIHLKIGQSLETKVCAMNDDVHSKDANDCLDLCNVDQPHMSLYLTDWREDEIKTLKNRIDILTSEVLNPCIVDMQEVFVNGAYGMWNASVSRCLQAMSDTIVNSTHDLIVPNQPVPQWVLNLPPGQERRRKIEYVHKYGSPTVFDQFVAHVTLAYDDTTPDVMAKAVKALYIKPGQSFLTDVVGMGSVGPHGTVLRGKDIADFYLQ